MIARAPRQGGSPKKSNVYGGALWCYKSTFEERSRRRQEALTRVKQMDDLDDR